MDPQCPKPITPTDWAELENELCNPICVRPLSAALQCCKPVNFRSNPEFTCLDFDRKASRSENMKKITKAKVKKSKNNLKNEFEEECLGEYALEIRGEDDGSESLDFSSDDPALTAHLESGLDSSRSSSSESYESFASDFVTGKIPAENLPITIEDYRFMRTELPELKTQWNTHFCVERLISVIWNASEVPVEKVEGRAQDLWNFYTRWSPNGINLHDVKRLLDILVLLRYKYAESSPEFVQDLTAKILKHFSGGIRLKNMKSKLYPKKLVDFLSGIGHIYWKNDSEMNELVVQLYMLIMSSFEPKILNAHQGKLFRKNNKPPPPDLDKCEGFDMAIGLDLFMTCLERSYFPKVLMLKMANTLLKSDQCMSCYSLEILINMIQHSGKIREFELVTKRIQKHLYVLLNLLAGKMARLVPALIDSILLKCLEFSTKDECTKYLGLVVDFLMNLLDHAEDKGDFGDCMVETTCCGIPSFWIVLDALFDNMKKIVSKSSMNFRNDLAFCAYLLAKNIPDLRNGFGPFTSRIAAIVSSNILNYQSTTYVLDSTVEDVEFFTILVLMLDYIVKASIQGKAMVKTYLLVPVFTRMIIGPCTLLERFTVAGYNRPCQRLMNSVWKTYGTIASVFPEFFLHEEGIDAILNVLRIFGEHGKTWPWIVELFLDICRILTIQNDKTITAGSGDDSTGILGYFDERNGMRIFTSVLSQLVRYDFGVHQEGMVINALICCSTMGTWNDHQEEIFYEHHGVKIIVRLLRKLVLAPADKRHMNPLLQIAIADCIWNCIADSTTCLEAFLAYDGMFHILDLLESNCGPSAQLHILNSILELCEYPRCLDQMLYWTRRGHQETKRWSYGRDFKLSGFTKGIPNDKIGQRILDQDMTFPSLLCEIWRDEEERFGVLRDKNGVIASVNRPLMSQFADNFKNTHPESYENVKKFKDPGDSSNGPAQLDFLNSVRPKIFILIKKITNSTNTEATLLSGLSLKNQVTMQIIINMLDLKRGEIYQEMFEEIKNEGLGFVESDRVAMDRYVKIGRNKVAAVIDTQKYLIQLDKENDENRETHFYNTLKKCYLQDHIFALKEAELIARTSDYNLLMDKRLWQKVQLERAYQNIQTNARVHRTMDHTLNITAWPGRSQSIDTEPLRNVEIPTDDKTFQGLSKDEKKSVLSMLAEGTPLQSKYKFTSVGRAVTSTVLFPSLRPSVLISTESELDFYPRALAHFPTQQKSTNDTPDAISAHEGYYEISPQLLTKALNNYMIELKKWNWKDYENSWMLRTKWNPKYYS